MDLCIVGAGEMGTWLGATLAAADAEFDLAFADTDPAAAERAAATVGGDAVPVDTGDAAGAPVGSEGEGEETGGRERRPDGEFDAVAVAVPIPAVGDAVATYAPRAERALLDVTGVMGPALDAMREHAPDRERLSMHPMFSEANAPGRIAAVHDARGPVTDAVREALVAAGNDVFDTTAADHDDAMTTVQANAHAAVLAFGLAAEPVDPRYHTDVSAAMFDLVANVTGGTARVFGDIQTAFDGAADVAAAADRLAATRGDPDAFTALYEEAGRLGDAPSDDHASEGASSESDHDRLDDGRSADEPTREDHR